MIFTPVVSICVFAAVLCGVCQAAENTVGRTAIGDKEIAAVVERAKSDPQVLWEIKNAPIDKAFQPLADLWFTGRYLVEQRLNSRKVGEENERQWLDFQKQAGRDPDTAERIFPVAGEVLFSHPDLEAYLTVELQKANNFLTDYYVHHRDTPGKTLDPNIVNECLGVAMRMPGDGAFRVVGSFLSAPDFPDLDRGDIRPRAPAKGAQSGMAHLAKVRLGEDIPNDPKNVEATRKWWAENQHRFAAKPKPESQSATPAPASVVAGTPQPPPPLTTGAAAVTAQGNKRWLLAAVAGLFVVLATGAWLYSRSART